MADSLSYPSANHYLSPHAQYCPPTHVGHTHVHQVMQNPPRQEIPPRKRPKYTRSKTGCMTCRVKKIKCDETKPNCMRCTHGQRECTWPEGVPARKKPTPRKDSADGRPSTASSAISETSGSSTTHERSPPRRQEIDLNLMPITTQRRPNDAYLQLQPIASDMTSMRQAMPTDRSSPYSQHHNPTPNLLSMIPENNYQTRYDHYANPMHRSVMQQPTYRSLGHSPMVHHWNPPPEQLNPYQYPTMQDRSLMAHHTSVGESHRYQ